MRLSVACILMIAITFTNCKKENAQSPRTHSYIFNATINRSSFQTDSIFAILMIYTSSLSRFIEIRGVGVSDWASCIVGDSSASTNINSGTYQFSHVMPGALFSYLRNYLSGSPQAYDGISGSVSILSCDSVNHKISGSFDATLVDNLTNDTVRITDASFSNAPFSIRYN